MKFEFDIELTDYWNEDEFKSDVMQDVKYCVVTDVYNRISEEFKRETTESIREQVYNLVKVNKQEIIDKVVEAVAEKILQQKAIKEELPKKSEINAINKEWANYFDEKIAEAMDKKFKKMWGC